MELNTPEALYQHYKNVRQRIETSSREAAIKNGIIVLPIRKLPPPEQGNAAAIGQKEDALITVMEPPKHLSEIQKILYEAAVKHGIRVSDIRGQVRQKNFVLARHEAMWEVKKRRPKISLHMIGRLFGNRDHTTVLHAIRKHQERLDAQKELCA
tara:strand:+ start:6310 stop:6771 length:462 start_codon:yes stop_codon:yes gene_type:complete